MKPNRLTIFSLITLLASACGQPGPLYLPEEVPPANIEAESKTDRNKDLQAPPVQAEPQPNIETDNTQ